MGWDEIRDLHVEFLAEQGFRPKVDDEGADPVGEVTGGILRSVSGR